MMKDKKRGVPPYVAASVTPEDWEAAKREYARLMMQPCWGLVAATRTSTLAAVMNSGFAVPALLAIEFKDFIEARGYKPSVR